MSIKIMNEVWQNAPVKDGALIVLLALADWADDDGECFPLIGQIATKSRMSERNVKRVLSALEEGGLIARSGTIGGRGKRPSYIVKTDFGEPELPFLKGDNLSEKGDNLSKMDSIKGDKCDTKRVTICPERVTNATSHIDNHHTTTNKPSTGARDFVEDDFAKWYEKYPRKEGRGQAIKAYRSARKKADAETISAGLDRYVSLITRNRTERRFIKLPASWLNGECWDDDLGPGNTPTPNGPAPRPNPLSTAHSMADRILSQQGTLG